MNNLIKNYKEVFLYLLFGFLTTLVNFVVYIALTFTILSPGNPLELQIANVSSWIISVIFAYVTNRKYVFKSHDKVFSELTKFTGGRLFSLILDMVIMFIGVSILKINDLVIKFISQIVIIIFNYIFSKIFVFKKNSNL